MTDRIRIAHIKEHPIDFLEGANEDDLGALLDAVEAAHALVADKPSIYVGIETQWKPLRDALARFDFGDDEWLERDAHRPTSAPNAPSTTYANTPTSSTR